MKKRFIILFLSFLIAGSFTSCYKDLAQQFADIKGIQGNPHLSVPLVNDELTIKDLYTNFSKTKGTMVEASDKFLTFIFNSTDSIKPNQFIKFPPVSTLFSLSLDQTSLNQFNSTGSFANSFSDYAKIVMSNKEQIRLLKVSQGSFRISLSSTFKQNLAITIIYPSISKSGSQLNITVHLNYKGTSPIQFDSIVDLSGYDIDLTNGGFSYNILPYLYQASMTKIPGQTALPSDQVGIIQSVEVDAYSYMQGYLGKFVVLSTSENNLIDILDNHADGNVAVLDPKIRIALNNGIGLPITARISNVRVIAGNGDEFPVNVNQFQDTFTFDYPRVAKNQVGQIVSSNFVIDKTNSNIDSVYSRAPKSITYDLLLTANYAENTNEENFIFDNNQFTLNSAFEFPLDLKIKDYYIPNKDTLQLPAQDQNLHVDWYKLTTTIENGLPIGSVVQFYFCKTAYINNIDSFVIVDSLLSAPFYVPGAVVDANGKILQKSVASFFSSRTADQYDWLRAHSDKLLLTNHIRTSDLAGLQPFVKFYSDQSMNIRVGIEAQGTYKLK